MSNVRPGMHTQTPTQKFKSRFTIFNSQEIGSNLLSLKLIFEAHLLGSKLQKIPEFNLPTTFDFYFFRNQINLDRKIIQLMKMIRFWVCHKPEFCWQIIGACRQLIVWKSLILLKIIMILFVTNLQWIVNFRHLNYLYRDIFIKWVVVKKVP